jgi:soluble lytic murein transglycosylase-like protein
MNSAKIEHVLLGLMVGCLASWAFIHADETRKAKYDGIVTALSGQYGIPADLVHSIIKAESDYDHRAVSDKGAMGLMQLMPATARQYDVDDVFDPVENIEGGLRYLKDLMRLYNRRTDLVLAAYNAGQEAVKKYNGIPPYRETINYIEKIKRTYKKPTIGLNTVIYRYVDENGRVVLTNNYYEYKSHTKDTGRK